MTLDEFIRANDRTKSYWADHFGISRQQLHSLINGNAKPSIETAAKIERLTNGIVRMQSWVGDDDG